MAAGYRARPVWRSLHVGGLVWMAGVWGIGGGWEGGRGGDVEQRPRLSATAGVVVGCPRKGEQGWWPTRDLSARRFPEAPRPVPGASWVQAMAGLSQPPAN